MPDKYISFEPWPGGFSNIRMSYEIAATISVVTGRTLILPKKSYCLFLSGQTVSSWLDIFDLFDLNKFGEHFDYIFSDEIDIYKALETPTSLFHGIADVAKIITFNNSDGSEFPPVWMSNSTVLICGKQYCDRAQRFIDNRVVIDLETDDAFIHFPRNLFGHFYYHVYADSIEKRNLIKTKIHHGICFQSRYVDMASCVMSELGSYNAIHVRRNDFLVTRRESALLQLEILEKDLIRLLDSSLPLYIATDEINLNLYDSLRNHFNIYFLGDFFAGLDHASSIAVEQIICANAYMFLGSAFSTFSDSINILRGSSSDRLDCHRKGTNFERERLNYQYYPWESEAYSWHLLWDYCWKFEPP